MALIAYARVSTDEQTTDPQVDALRQAGCAIIYKEHASGGDRSRPELRRAIDRCGKGDVLVVARIDRLARSLSHLLEVIEELDRKGAGFRSLGDPIDTTSPQGRFTLQILGAVAEFERALIRERTKAGMRAAAAKGRAPGNRGLKARDPAMLRKVAAGREDALTRKVIVEAQPIIATVERLRPLYPWDVVVRQLAAEKIFRGDGRPWTRDGLIRACRRLARDGFIRADVLEAARRRTDSGDLVDLVAAIASSLPSPTLGAIATRLQELRQRTPRGGLRWSPSSVKNLLDQAKAAGLVAEEVCT